MLKSQLFYGITICFALYSFYITFYGFFLAGTKLSQTSDINLLEQSNNEWFQPKGKVVMLLFDALRFDYLLNQELTQSNKRLPDHKLKKLNNLMAENPENFVILRAHADAPTMTVNRIPCIATGNIPPKASLLQALEALPAIEDSFPKQLRMLKRKSYFSGDPLWVEYFPQEFTESGPALGFNIKDPNVDLDVISFMNKKLAENDFDLLLTHILSVDHMGHSYGLKDDRVKEKIAVNDQLILDIIDTIDDDTTLVILGDHGMDALGTHGGGSIDETSTAIVAFHKKGFQKYKQTNLTQVMRSINETVLSVKQQDIAPTLSMLMGIPIPFSNMGQMINDIYPAVDYTAFEQKANCPGASFEAQMLRDNYLNTLQILNYMKTFQLDSHLFAMKDLDHVASLEKEVSLLYEKATDMIKSSQQCEAPFHDLVVETILKCQKISEQVYNLTRAAGAFDMPLIHEGIALLILVVLMYVLIMQYLYRRGHNEKHITFSAKSFSEHFKRVLPIIITIGLAVIITWYYKKKAIHCYTTVAMCSAFWFCGSLIVSFFGKKTDEKNHRPIPQTPVELKICKGDSEVTSAQKSIDTSTDEIKDISKSQTIQDNERLFGSQEGDNDHQPVLQKPLLFVLQAPFYSALAIAIVAYCLYCVQVAEFDSMVRKYVNPASPFVLFLTAAYRIHRLYPHKFNPIIPLTVVSCMLMFFQNVRFSSQKIRIIFGLLLLLDFVCSEIHYMTTRFKTSKVWGFAYLISFGLLVPFHLADNRESYWIEILIPRIIWGILIGIIIFRCALFRIEGRALVRNLQLCFVLYLILLQWSKIILPFAVLLTAMKVIGHLFKRASALNYVYPVIISFVSQFGLHILGNNDRNIPMRFDIGFIGLHDFNFFFTPLMVFLNFTTPYLLGMISISHHNQSLDIEENGQFFKISDKKATPLSNSHIKVIKKRNILPFLFMFSVIYFGSVMKCYMWRYYFLDEAQDKFMIDSVIYILVMFGGFFMF